MRPRFWKKNVESLGYFCAIMKVAPLSGRHRLRWSWNHIAFREEGSSKHQARAESLSLRQLKLRKLSGGERKIEWSYLAELCQKKKQWKIKNDGISVSDWIGIIIFSHWKNKYKMIPIFFLYMLLFFFFRLGFLSASASAGERIWGGLLLDKVIECFQW